MLEQKNKTEYVCCLNHPNLLLLCRSFILKYACADPEGGQGVRTPPPPENHKDIGFLSNTGPDPIENHKATKHLMLGHHLKGNSLVD